MAGAVDFALIGHQESWPAITRLVHALRDPRHGRLEDETVRQVVPWIPPRTVVRLRAASVQPSRVVSGVYVESFVTPEELGAGSARRALDKVRAAIQAASREGARIASLGGFSSILLEGRTERVEEADGMALTTGNSLTAALIVHGVEAAAEQAGIRMADAALAVVGATGDVGSACARWFAGRARRLVLAARGGERLARLRLELRKEGNDVGIAPDAGAALAEADLVIAAASLSEPALDPRLCRPGAIVCDAGYPKNLRAAAGGTGPRIFWGGIGVVGGGWWSDDGRLERFYGFPAGGAYAGHGCMLEGLLLAMEGRYESFSRGRGKITPERIREIWAMAERHGIGLAPFFDGRGAWRELGAATC